MALSVAAPVKGRFSGKQGVSADTGRTGLRAGRLCGPTSPYLSLPLLFGTQGLAADLKTEGCYHNAIIS